MRRFFVFLVVCSILVGVAPVRAAEPVRFGLQDGWAIGDQGDLLFTDQVAGQIAETGAGWVRIHFRLGTFTNWTDTAPFGYSALAAYDRVIEVARSRNLKVLGLVTHESYWRPAVERYANNAETAGGNGDNAYVRGFVSDVVALLARHYGDRIAAWEIWNEPNGFGQIFQAGALDQTGGPAAAGMAPVLRTISRDGTLTTGGSFLYPSNYAWLLNLSYRAIWETNVPVTVLFGGVLGQDIGGESGFHAGSDYIDAVYAAGIASAGWRDTLTQLGTYPLDGIAQHLYTDQRGQVSEQKVRKYLALVRDSYLKYEGAGTSKQTWITEYGWATDQVSEKVQAENLWKTTQILAGTPYVASAFWYNLRSISAAKIYRGLFRPDGSANPAHQAFRALATPA